MNVHLFIIAILYQCDTIDRIQGYKSNDKRINENIKTSYQNKNKPGTLRLFRE